MKKFGVQLAFEAVREATTEWSTAKRKFDSDIAALMGRLLHEAARNYMSAEEVARHSGFTVKRVRLLMRAHNLDPKNGKTLLAKKAADNLAENAELLGVEPHEFDLMSPLAYLPAGKALKERLLNPPTVIELPEDRVARLVEVFQNAWHEADARGLEGQRTTSGINAVLEAIERETEK